ncbi:MAG TPA: hypothetical protein VLS94_08820 [Fusibacter sp.]|nr:hypothetical protein [Fusibacter sp.]
MNEFNKLEVIKLIYKVVGHISPIGVSETDEQSLKNITLLIDVVRELLDDIMRIESEYEDHSEYSIQKIVEKCTKFLNEISEFEKK